MAFPETSGGVWPRWKENRLFTLLLAIFMAYLIVLFAFFIKNEAKKTPTIGKAPAERQTIAVDGNGKVVGAPDIATVDMGFTTQKTDVQSALTENNGKMNRLNEALKKLGIDTKDIQTTRFNVYPNYDYTRQPNVIVGYTADQGVTVKIRDLGKVALVLQVAGDVGANQVSGLNFTIEDPETLRAEAREKAITMAMEKAGVLGKQLGIKLVRVVNFSESSGGYYPPVYYDKLGGYGGVAAPPAPDIQVGSLDITSNVVVTFEIE